MPKFFVSYVYEDKFYLDQIKDWHAKGQLGRWEPVFETEDVRLGGNKAIRGHVSPLIHSCQALVALIGNDTHNHDAVSYEVQNARSAPMPVVPVRLPKTTGAPPPSVPEPKVAFRSADLLEALSQLR